MIRVKKSKKLLRLIALASFLFIVPGLSWTELRAEAAEGQADVAMVWLVDVSGSMDIVDPQRCWSDAVALGVDLAPENTIAAFIAVNDTILARTGLLDVTSPDGRDKIKATSRNTPCMGNTDFSVGLAEAAELLNASTAKDKNLYLIGDICESGFMPRDGQYEGLAEKMAEMIKICEEGEIKVHLFFMSVPLENHQFMPLWEELAEKSGGSLTNIGEPYDLAKAVESNFFRNFSYQSHVITIVDIFNSEMDVQVTLPVYELERVRVYASPSTPRTGLKFSAEGAQGAYSASRFYAMVDLTDIMPQSVILTLPSDKGADTRVYLLTRGKVTFAPKADSFVETDSDTGEYRQRTALALSVEQRIDGVKGIDFDAQITLKSPQGSMAAAENVQFVDNSFSFDFYPQEFRAYVITLSLDSQGVNIAADAVVYIDEIVLPEVAKPGTDLSLWIAIVIGALLILSSLLFAVIKRRKQKEQPGDLPAGRSAYNSSVYTSWEERGSYVGKLDIYGVLVQDGAAEIPASSVRLEQFAGRKSISLHDVFELAGIPFNYHEAQRIFLIPSPDHKLLVKNQSDAVIYSGGQPRYKGQQAVLLFGQKMTVTFENEVNEYEIYFHHTLDKADVGKNVHLEVPDYENIGY